MKTQTILTAQTLGYFRAKSAEKKAAIFAEMLELEEFDSEKESEYRAILEAETLRRQVVSQNRAKKAIERAEVEASKPLTAGVDDALAHVETRRPGVYVLTAAQNNTDVDPVCLAALQNYCNRIGAELLVAKITYNKNGFQQSQETTDGVYYDPQIAKYLVEGQIDLGGVHFVAQANVLPTAKNPLSGFEGITPIGIHAVIPASKIALKCTAALKGGAAKILFSTGTVTKRNYIVRKAGAVAATEHNIGALFVDTTGTTPVIRQLEVMPGSDGFYDEGYFYDYRGNAIGYQNPAALQLGDIHAEKMERENLDKLVRLIGQYQPNNVILHDVMDFSSRNHHNIKDCAFMFAQHVKNQTVADDIRAVAQVIDTLTDGGPSIHIIESNHDLAINTWLKNTDFKTDPVNALTYLRCMVALYQHIEKTGNTRFNMLEFAYKEIGGGRLDSIHFHETDESVIMAGVEMGCHGHTGTNGSKGSPAQFRALGVPMNTGHTHTPSIMGGCYTAGVAGSLDMGYNIGASSWQLANIVTWANGQRQIIFM